MPTHFSLDIETLDTKTSAVVLSIGVCSFTEEAIGPWLHVSLDIDKQLAAGRTISDGTFRWWVDQLLGMANNPFPKDVVHPHVMLNDLRTFFTNNLDPEETLKDAYIWVRGPHFDWSIIESLNNQFSSAPYKVLGINYSHIRDQRTFCAGEKYKPSTDIVMAHDALNDAISQAIFIQQVSKKYSRPFC